MKNRVLSSEISEMTGKNVVMAGWVNIRRDHGKLIFIDLRDREGLTQLVVLPNHKDAHSIADTLRPEFVIKIEGIVNKRPLSMINDKMSSGSVEIEVESIEILNQSITPPFEINKDSTKIDEETRLKYRYLDLRTERMNENIHARSLIIQKIRDFYRENQFIEIETPCITKGTPEGSREYIVPSRLHEGKFYVLPQSPQQFKQLLMVAGFERYFQIAKCFRDEDPRGDRQPEFTQLDIEISFTDQEEIIKLFEDCLIKIVKELYPNKKIAKIPFTRLTYDESIKKYNSDKPDLRKNKNDKDELAFCWITDMPMFEYSKTEKKLVSVHHPFTRPQDKDTKYLSKDPLKAKAYAYDIVLNGNEIGGGSIRIHESKLQNQIFKILGLNEKEIESRFGHMTKAFEFGAPPHGGMASGIDRLAMILQNEDSIREVICFPKTGDAQDLMMGAPSELPKSQLKDSNISNNK